MFQIIKNMVIVMASININKVKFIRHAFKYVVFFTLMPWIVTVLS